MPLNQIFEASLLGSKIREASAIPCPESYIALYKGLNIL